MCCAGSCSRRSATRCGPGGISPLRADAIGIDVKRVQWLAFVIAGVFGGLAGTIYVFSKGSVSPDVISVGKSVDGLVMVLLGGIQALTGPIIGAAVFGVLQDSVMRATDYWRALFGGIILFLVLAFPQGLAGISLQIRNWWQHPRMSMTAERQEKLT